MGHICVQYIYISLRYILMSRIVGSEVCICDSFFVRGGAEGKGEGEP